MRFYHTYENRRGKYYGVGMKPGCDAHTRGWHAGVSVRVIDDNGQDQFAVTMTGGSNGRHAGMFLGTVTDTPDGPRWTPGPVPEPGGTMTDDGQAIGKPDGPTEEDHGLAKHALRLAIDTLLAADCTFAMCPGHAAPFQDMTCARCAAIQDLRAELRRITGSKTGEQ